MAWPVAFLSAGILIPKSFLSGKADHEVVGPGVAVKVVGVGEEIVGVGVLATQLTLEAGDRALFTCVEGDTVRVNGVAGLEIRPCIPIRSTENVGFAVGVHIGHARTLRPEVVADFVFHPFPRRLGRLGGNDRSRGTGGG